jgi:hypothetical protein
VPVTSGHELGRVRPGRGIPVRVHDRRGEDVTDRYLRVEGDRLVFAASVTPVMLTRTVEATRRDCLGYLAEPLPPVGWASPTVASHSATSTPANRSPSSGATGTSARSTR